MSGRGGELARGGEPVEDVVGGAEGEGLDGDHGVDADGGGEDAGVGDEEALGFPGFASGVDGRSRRVDAHAATAHLVGGLDEEI